MTSLINNLIKDQVRGQQGGQAFSEYALLVAAILGVVGFGSTDFMPIFPEIIRSFQIYLDSLHMVVTLPIP